MSIISVNLFFLGYMYFTTASVLYICFLKRHLLSFQAILPSGEKNSHQVAKSWTQLWNRTTSDKYREVLKRWESTQKLVFNNELWNLNCVRAIVKSWWAKGQWNSFEISGYRNYELKDSWMWSNLQGELELKGLWNLVNGEFEVIGNNKI